MSRRFLPPIVLLVLLLFASTSTPATAAAEAILQSQVAEAPSAVGCSRSAAAAAQVVVDSCTDDIVRSFFGVRGSDVCCRALQAVGAGCYRAVFSGSPFVDIYAPILGNVCGLAAAPAPSPGGRRMTE
ncbi:hypothetical protein ACQ4PT_038662 [Festuca glaucescens]